MAIQHTDLQNTQPKVFYATDHVFQDSRTKLQEVKSHFELVKTGKVLTLWDGNSTKRKLTQLLPQSVHKPVDNPLELRHKQLCNEMVEYVTGSPGTDMYPTCSHRIHVEDIYTRVVWGGLSQIAALVAALMGHSEGQQGARRINAESFDEIYEIDNAIAREYHQALNDPNGEKLDRILQELKVNQYASPDVGDAFVIGSVAGPDKKGRLTDLQTGITFKPKWAYHYAGVVAKSGSDTVTLENYARGGEVEGNQAQDPRWYFQMYGTKEHQSFHEANVALGGYANAVTTAQYNKAAAKQRELERKRAAMMKKVKVGGVVVTVLLLGIALEFLRRYMNK